MSRDWADGRGLRLSAEDFDAAVQQIPVAVAGARAIADDVLCAVGRKLVANYLRELAARPNVDLLAEAETLDPQEQS